MSQVGGSHYEDMPIQPWEVIDRAELDFWEGNVIKYVMRYRAKNGVEDLKKARHYLDYLIDRESRGLDSSGKRGRIYTRISLVHPVEGVPDSKER